MKSRGEADSERILDERAPGENVAPRPSIEWQRLGHSGAIMSDKLQEHIFSTYLTLRYGIVAIAALLPLVVYAVGAFHDVPLQNSISAYYWAPDGANAPSRDWLVGSLFAIAAFLYLYKGFSTAENIALNLAAILAVGVAVFPMEWDCGAACGKFSVHGLFAVAMFACLVYVVWFRAGDTLPLVPENATPSRARLRQVYVILGVVMLASPVTAIVLNTLIGTRANYVFFIEAAGIWAFALYWWVKSSELKRSAATVKALHGEVEGPPGAAGGPLTPAPGGEKAEARNSNLRG
jgi:cytochrome b561